MKQIFVQNLFMYRAKTYSSPSDVSTSAHEVPCFIYPIVSNKKQILINHSRGKDLFVFLFKNYEITVIERGHQRLCTPPKLRKQEL